MQFQILTPREVKPLSGLGGICLGHEYAVTDQYLMRDGKPYLYRMGEMHFSRISQGDWERELLKMKTGGIEIVASYLIWNHHEEIEGEFVFDGSCDLHRFCEVCRKVDMPFFLRIGPWAHGEVRNGGFPDWLMEKCGGMKQMRGDFRPYLDYVERFFARVYEEVKDMSDVILGIQLENELCNRPEHIAYLKDYLSSLGFAPPLWSATAWGGGTGAAENVPREGVLPMYGGYPEAPWDPSLKVKYDHDSFFFRDERGSAGIGTDLLGQYALSHEEEHTYPYLSCELGGGNQVTYHRRPIISTSDLLAITVCMLGSGVNGLGYYMYHGGKNPIGKKSTLQETRSAGDLNDYSCVSYDFQSPLGDCGQVRESYYRLRSIFEFVDCYGEVLSRMPAFMPRESVRSTTDLETLRAAVRSDGGSGFLFVNNHVHGVRMGEKQQDVLVSFPSGKKIRIKLCLAADAIGIIPLRFQIGSLTAEYVTALPVSVTSEEIVFEANQGIAPEIALEDGSVISMRSDMELGGVKLILREPETPKVVKGSFIAVKRRETKLPNDAFAHLRNRDDTPLTQTETAEFELCLPNDTAYLSIKAEGNVAAIYQDGKMFDDFYLFGDTWTVDVRKRAGGSPLVLKLLPLNEADLKKIYFETAMPCGICTPEVSAISLKDAIEAGI